MNPTDFEFSHIAILPPGLMDRVRSELDGGEKLLWVGRPRIGPSVMAALPNFVFGIFFGGFAVFWTAMASRAPSPFFWLFGLPFMGVGLFMLASPILAAFLASKTCYALSDRRALVWEPSTWGGHAIRSYRPDLLRKIWRNERGDGSGDVIFEEWTTYGRKGRSQLHRRGFLAIDRVREVEALIRSRLLGEIDPPRRID